jgi:hypothetical protein
LKDERHNRADDRQAESNGREGELKPRSEEEKQVWEVLEQARQDVKSVVKKELEAEIVTSELFNLRLRNPSR